MTRLFGVIGDPIGHSLSPRMHTAAFAALRLDALYAPFEVPKRFLAPMLRALVLAGVEGLNVTVPLKEAVLPLVDRLDPTARAIGAVNTLVIRGRRMAGYNTDGVGLRHALAELGWPRPASGDSRGWPPRPDAAEGRGGRPDSDRIVLLGAGGAARAVAWELSRPRGRHLTVANRRLARARALARWLMRRRPHVRVEAVSLSRVRLDGAALLVNATTLGMRPDDAPPVDVAQLRPGLVVYDLVYHRETALVAAARRRGCVAANGKSMLLYQGAASWRLWLRRSPPIEAMRRALIETVRTK